MSITVKKENRMRRMFPAAGPAAWITVAELAWNLAGHAWAFGVLLAAFAWLAVTSRAWMATTAAKAYSTEQRVNSLVPVIATTNSRVGNLSGSGTSSNGLADGTINGTSATHGLTDGTVGGRTGDQVGGAAAHYHWANANNGNLAVNNGQHSHGPGSYAVANGQHTHNLRSV